MAYSTQAPLHVIYLHRDTSSDWKRPTVEVSERVELVGNKGHDLQKVVSLLEEAIRAHPDHWWGWGRVRQMRPEHIHRAQEAGDYALKSTSRVRK